MTLRPPSVAVLASVGASTLRRDDGSAGEGASKVRLAGGGSTRGTVGDRSCSTGVGGTCAGRAIERDAAGRGDQLANPQAPPAMKTAAIEPTTVQRRRH